MLYGGALNTSFHFFPFDLFGGGGARAGVELLADAVREMLEDNRRERVPTRARAYARKVRLTDWAFDKLEDYRDWRTAAARAIKDDLGKGDFVVWCSGNHLGVLPVYESLGPDTVVLQFDAHLDIHNLTDCTSELSHGNFLLHRKKPGPHIVNVGHRDLLLRPEYITEHYEQAAPATIVHADYRAFVGPLRSRFTLAKQIWIDIDCDVFDVAYFPGIAQSLPFGLSPSLVLTLLDELWSDKVIGLSLSEFDTARDVRDQSLATLVWLLEWTLLRVHET